MHVRHVMRHSSTRMRTIATGKLSMATSSTSNQATSVVPVYAVPVPQQGRRVLVQPLTGQQALRTTLPQMPARVSDREHVEVQFLISAPQCT